MSKKPMQLQETWVSMADGCGFGFGFGFGFGANPLSRSHQPKS
jgi:hypothetical protein